MCTYRGHATTSDAQGFLELDYALQDYSGLGAATVQIDIEANCRGIPAIYSDSIEFPFFSAGGGTQIGSLPFGTERIADSASDYVWDLRGVVVR